MKLQYDNALGDYRIVLQSAADNPFDGQFRINLILFNPDVGTTACNPSRFSSVGNDYDLSDPQQELILDGNAASLKAWSVGDRVATTSDAFDSPDCSGTFRSAVNDLPISGGASDTIAGGSTSSQVVRSGPIFADRFAPTVAEPNQLPVAGPSRAVTVSENQVEAIVMTGSDADGDALSFEVVDAPVNGALSTINATGPSWASVDYTPDSDFVGDDSFTYRASDGMNESLAATISITVEDVNEPPTAVEDSASVDEDGSEDIDVLANDSDPDGSLDVTTVSITTLPGNGGTSVNDTTGVITYTPDPDFFGEDSFVYEVCDDGNPTPVECDSALVSVTVNPVNDAPTALADSATVNEDDEVAIDVLANDSDPDGSLDPETVNVTSGPGNGLTSVDSTSSQITYTPNANYYGSDSFIYEVCDGGNPSPVSCDSATVDLTVVAVNDQPSLHVRDAQGTVNVPYESNDRVDFSPGPANEASQSVEDYVIDGITGSVSFDSGPSISDSGVLTFEANTTGEAHVNVFVIDDGGTANGGDDTSQGVTFKITVCPEDGCGGFVIN